MERGIGLRGDEDESLGVQLCLSRVGRVAGMSRWARDTRREWVLSVTGTYRYVKTPVESACCVKLITGCGSQHTHENRILGLEQYEAKARPVLTQRSRVRL